jgi:predicted SAM-dependent methyltransferase
MSEMRLAPIARGLLTYVPGIHDLLPSKAEGQTTSARYCYDLWIRHLTLLHAHGYRGTPGTVAELGPGETLGVGICALLSGADHYVGLDVVAHSNAAKNQQILEKLVPLFETRIPSMRKGWPDFSEYLDERRFPSQLLTDDILAQSLRPKRVDNIRRALTDAWFLNPITVDYKAPWTDPHVIDENSVDLIISASVLEHVVDLPGTYRALYKWLKPGGWMAHQIDLKAHGMTRRWNGFRTCSEGIWKLAHGRRPYSINRYPASVHLQMMRDAGFRLVTEQKLLRDDGIRREELAPRWADISDEDLNCSALYVIATR